MDTTKHTPGPWRWRNEPYPDGSPYIRFTAGCGYFQLSEPREQGFEFTGIASEADARLIAAAPELLEALEIVRDMATAMRGEDFNLGYDQWKIVHAAIKKARGG